MIKRKYVMKQEEFPKELDPFEDEDDFTKTKKTKAPKDPKDPNAPKVKKVKVKKVKKNYVDPKIFTAQILEYYKTNKIVEPLGESVYNIATRLSFAPNFINYTYKEEMIGDAIIKMFNALKNQKFDPNRGNAFSYFTKIAYNAFRNRIKKEKKEHEVLLDYQAEVFETLTDVGHLQHQETNTENTDSEDQ